MSYPVEQNEKFAAYAHPERLVSTEWLATALEGGALGDGKLVVVESDEDVLAHFGKPLIDVRSPEEYTGQRTHMPAYPEEGALRGGHIPTAASIPWARAAAGDGTYRNRAELEALYLGEAGLTEGDDVVAY